MLPGRARPRRALARVLRPRGGGVMLAQAPDPGALAMRVLADMIDPAAEVEYRRVLCREAALAERDRAWSQGYAAAIADVKAAEHGTVAAVRLAGLRSRPGGAAWLAEVERHGGTEYGGAGKPRRPVPPEVIEQARRDLGRTAR
jgi:hypothetical protein